MILEMGNKKFLSCNYAIEHTQKWNQIINLSLETKFYISKLQDSKIKKQERIILSCKYDII